jgi:hypothetical protein
MRVHTEITDEDNKITGLINKLPNEYGTIGATSIKDSSNI